MKSGIASVIVLVLVGAGVAGYFLNRNKVDTKDADTKLKTIVEKVVAPVSSVDCPAASRKKGSTFDCKVTFVGGRTSQLKVTITNDDGGFDLNWEKPITSAEKTAQMIISGIKAQMNKDATADCGKGVVDLPLKCTVTMDGQTGHANVKEDPATHQILWNLEN